VSDRPYRPSWFFWSAAAITAAIPLIVLGGYLLLSGLDPSGGLASVALAAAGTMMTVPGVVLFLLGSALWRAALRRRPTAMSSLRGVASSPRAPLLLAACGCAVAVVAIVALSGIEQHMAGVRRDSSNLQQGLVQGELRDEAFGQCAESASTQSVKQIVLDHTGASFRVQGVYSNRSGVYRVLVTHVDYPYARYVFRVVADSQGLHWPDTASQRSLRLQRRTQRVDIPAGRLRG
jgi:hypothetical protein